MYKLSLLLPWTILGLLLACAPKPVEYATVSRTPQTAFEPPAAEESSQQRPKKYDESLFIPDTNYLDHFPMQEVRVNLHFMNTTDTLFRYNGAEGVKYGQDLVYYANSQLNKNRKSSLTPSGMEVPTLPTRYYLKLVNKPGTDKPAVYFHYDDELYWYLFKGRNRNIGDRRIIDKYAVDPKGVLNIFFMAPPRDSLDSPTFSTGQITGVYLGNAIKIAGVHPINRKPWEHAGNINHEIGHAFGLHHAWLRHDGCTDTRSHANNCWTPDSGPHCDTMYSNNIMDYSYLQNAWTPCQIGRIHARMRDPESKQRGWLTPKWCKPWNGKEIIVDNTTVWEGERDLRKHIRIKSGARLRINSRTHLATGRKIIIEPGGILELGPKARIHNICGGEWGGIEAGRQGRQVGEVRIENGAVLENFPG